jgi:hypothetical protein
MYCRACSIDQTPEAAEVLTVGGVAEIIPPKKRVLIALFLFYRTPSTALEHK